MIVEFIVGCKTLDFMNREEVRAAAANYTMAASLLY